MISAGKSVVAQQAMAAALGVAEQMSRNPKRRRRIPKVLAFLHFLADLLASEKDETARFTEGLWDLAHRYPEFTEAARKVPANADADSPAPEDRGCSTSSTDTRNREIGVPPAVLADMSQHNSLHAAFAMIEPCVELTMEMERGDGRRLSLEDYLTFRGDYLALAAYAEFLCPVFRVHDGILWSVTRGGGAMRFDTLCHVDLVHQPAAPLKEKVWGPAGEILAHCWNQALRANRQPGRFVFDDSRDVDVVYEADD